MLGAGHHRCFGTGEVGRKPGDLVRLNVSMDLHRRVHRFGHESIGWVHVGIDWAGLNIVDGDLSSAEITRQCDYCQPVEVFDTTTFKCFFEVNGEGISETFHEQALELEAEYAQRCGLCPVAECVAPDYVRSTYQQSTCTLDVVTPQPTKLRL